MISNDIYLDTLWGRHHKYAHYPSICTKLHGSVSQSVRGDLAVQNFAIIPLPAGRTYQQRYAYGQEHSQHTHSSASSSLFYEFTKGARLRSAEHMAVLMLVLC